MIMIVLETMQREVAVDYLFGCTGKYHKAPSKQMHPHLPTETVIGELAFTSACLAVT